jgi:hypothetical protein
MGRGIERGGTSEKGMPEGLGTLEKAFATKVITILKPANNPLVLIAPYNKKEYYRRVDHLLRANEATH